jgi:hypothetical protein
MAFPDAANDVAAALHIFYALRDLAEPGVDILGQATGKNASAPSGDFQPAIRKGLTPSKVASSKGMMGTRAVTPRPRHLETYRLWHEDKRSVEEIASTMSIKPVSVLWNLVSCFSTVEGSVYDFSDQDFLQLYDTFGDLPPRLIQDAAELLAEVRARQEACIE